MSDGDWDAALAWLGGQLDEDERLALAAAKRDGHRWEATDEGDVCDIDAAGSGYIATGPWSGSLWETGSHIARHAPAAVLRRIESDRQILAAVERYLDPHPGLPCTNEGNPYESCDHHVAAAATAVDPYAAQLMALRYVEVPGFPEVLRLDQTEAR
ncbi:MAG TPA: DUF6221 family protein [Micromonosporaceae bacterium]|nr:DUF6221 family protein [Micromonosporaceae bacterium]